MRLLRYRYIMVDGCESVAPVVQPLWDKIVPKHGISTVIAVSTYAALAHRVRFIPGDRRTTVALSGPPVGK